MQTHPRVNGFTLIELLIALGVTSLLMAGVCQIVVSQYHAYQYHERVLEMQQNTRAAMAAMAREIRMAGFNAMDGRLVNNMDAWDVAGRLPDDPVPVNLDGNPKITLGENGDPDTLTFLSVLTTEHNPTELKEEAPAGATEITLTLSATDVAREYRENDLLHIGATSDYAVIQKVAGNVLTIDTNPRQPGYQGLTRGIPEKASVGEISMVTYAVFNDRNDPGKSRHKKGVPELKRNINGRGFFPVALNIEGLAFSSPESGVVEMTLTGRTQGEDDVRRYSLTRRFKVRNAETVPAGRNCPRAPAPGTLSITSGFDDDSPCSVTLAWSPVTVSACPVTGYRVYYGEVSGLYRHSVDVGPETTAAVDLAEFSFCECYLAVSAVNGAGAGAKSAEVYVEDKISAAPEDLSAEAGEADHQLTLSWKPGAACDVERYRLYRSVSSAGVSTPPEFSRMLGGKEVSYTDSGLLGCTEYLFSLAAKDRCGNWSSKAVVSGKATDGQAPAPPLDIRVDRKNQSHTLSWNLSPDDFKSTYRSTRVKDVAAYRVYVNGAFTHTVEGGTGTLAITDFQALDTYGVSAEDYCHNESAVIGEGSCESLPAVVIESPPSSPVMACAGDLTVLGSAAVMGERGIAAVYVALDDQPFQAADGKEAWSRVLNTRSVEDGIHDITARVIDTRGCIAEQTVSVQVDNERDTPLWVVTARACWDPDDGHVYAKVSVRDFKGGAITQADISSDLPMEAFTYLEDGWYGGGYSAGCMEDGGGCARSEAVYETRDGVPDTFRIAVTAGDALLEYDVPVD